MARYINHGLQGLLTLIARGIHGRNDADSECPKPLVRFQIRYTLYLRLSMNNYN